ncbi:MAG: tetratricopeptide repeat protein [Thermodesulfovibrionales bacterium]
MSRGEPGNGRLCLLAALLLAAVTITYSNHFQNSFHFDDSHAVVSNIYIRSLRNIPLFFRDAAAFSSLPANQTYRPVVLTSLALDHYLGRGLDPFYFHLSMFVLFVVQGLLMFLLYVRAFSLSEEHAANRYAALGAVAWYMLHPANAETINYISARSDTLSTLFGLVSMVLFIYSAFCRKWLIYLIPLTVAVLAKPIAVFFVPLLMVYVCLFEDAPAEPVSRKKKAAPSRTAFVLKETWPALLCAIILMLFTKAMTPPTFTPGGAPFMNYVITQPFVILHYGATFILPVSLSADTDWRPLSSIADPRFFAGALFIAALIYAVLYAAKHRRTRPIAFGLLWFLITLLPTSLFPLAEVMNDHRIFFPYVGLAMSICWTIFILLEKAKRSMSSGNIVYRAAIVVIVLALTGYAYGTHQRNKVWKTDETLWHDVALKSPKNGRGLMNYGLALMARADYAGAEKYFTDALALTPDYSYLHINMGILKEATGRSAEAEQYFKQALSSGPGYPVSYYYYARFLKNQGRVDEAIVHLHKAQDLASGYLDARHLLMDIYYERSDLVRLRELAGVVLSIAPDDKKAVLYLNTVRQPGPWPGQGRELIAMDKTPEIFLTLSLNYYRTGQFLKSIEAAREALKLRPDYDLAYNNICAAYNELKQWDKAIEAGEKAVQLNPDNQRARNNLSWARQQKMQGAK